MKLSRIFGFVLALHVAAVAFILLQPGCQTTPGDSARSTPSRMDPVPPINQREVDDSFNAGLSSNRQAPTRPSTTRTDADVLGAGEILEPLGAPPEQLTQGTYTIVRGDTLSGIARAHGVSLNDLLNANGLSRTSSIFPGQTLIIPAAGSSAPAPMASTPSAAEGQTYTVKSGDALARIARQFGVTVNDIKAANNLKSDTIRVGQKLIIPASGSAGSASNAPAPAAASTSGQTYVVQAGDVPAIIARRFGVSVNDLLAINNITDPRKMRVGQTLVLPTGARDSGSSGARAGAVSGGSKEAAVNRVENRTPAPVTTPAPTTPAPVRIAPSTPSTQPTQPSPVNELDQLEQLDDEEATPIIPLEELNSLQPSDVRP